MKKIFLLCLSVVLALSIAACSSSTETSSNSEKSTQQSETSDTPSKETVANLKPYNAEIENGYYTCGIDFPVGTYNLTAVKGNGNVTTDDGSINTIMGIDKDDMYEKEFKNAEFMDGTVLNLSGVTIKIQSKNDVDLSSLKKRKNTTTKSYKLSSGNYIAGEDIEVGTYDLTAVKGNGNVMTEDGELNAIMGIDKDDMYQKKYTNVKLDKGVKLEISDVTINLVPSK